MRLRRDLRRIAAAGTPTSTSLVSALATATRLSSSAKDTAWVRPPCIGDQHFGLRRLAGMDVPDRIGELLLHILARIGVEKALILVDGARDHVEIELLRLARLDYT